VVLATEHYDQPEPVNLGTGREITIRDLARLICALCRYSGELRWDPAQPDGQPRRCLDTSRARSAFGFQATTDLKDGLRETIAWYEKQVARKAGREAA
jgi:GDP-L-fucose synthase